MALAVILRGSKKIPALTNVASKLLASHSVKSSLVLTPIMARNFSALNRPALLESQKSIVSTRMEQNRMISHSTVWAMEKYLSAALLAIIPLCLFFPSPVADNLLAISMVLHMHWGVEAVLCDYMRTSWVGSTISTLVAYLIYLISGITLAGLLYFNYNDVGLAKAVSKLWREAGIPIVPCNHDCDPKKNCCRKCNKQIN